MSNEVEEKDAYSEAGVDVDAGNEAVEMIKDLVEQTFHIPHGEVLSSIGGFCAHVKLSDGRIVSASTDGVGTKLVVAILLGKHDTIGINLVAMCVNDLLADGVRPLFMLDYMALWKQIPAMTVEIMKGITTGCKQAGCALIGGEMAELPGMYKNEIYDLSSCAVGVTNSEEDLILGNDVTPGMYVYGLSASGVHSNGYSLYRKIWGIDVDESLAAIGALNTYYPEIGKTIGEELLIPTEIYVKRVFELIEKYTISGMANITGGGFIDNPHRNLPDGCRMVIDLDSWVMPSIFQLIREKRGLTEREMLRTTNCGMGFLVISPDEIKEEGVHCIGKIIEGKKGVEFTGSL